jgi:hypothetical protein
MTTASRRKSWLRSALVITSSLLITAAHGDVLAADSFVTAVSGGARLDGNPLTTHLLVDDGSSDIEIETDAGGSCALLHGESILLQLCGDTQVRIPARQGDAPQTIEVTRGELRVTTMRHRSGRRMEIRTPTAIARPFNTILHLSVEPTTGKTVITSLESRAVVVSTNPDEKRSAILNRGQQVTLYPGQAPGKIQKFDIEGLQYRSPCFSGEAFRKMAVSYDARNDGQVALSQIADSDIPEPSLPALVNPFQAPEGFVWGLTDSQYFESGCNPTSCAPFILPPPPGLAGPPICTGLPGEQCQRP